MSVMSMPGVQKPHCSACASLNAAWSGFSSPAGRGQAFDGLDLMPVGLRRQHDAGARRLAVEEDGAGAADAVLAPDVRAGETEILAEKVAQQQPRLDGSPLPRAVDDDFDGDDRAHEAGSLSQARINTHGEHGGRHGEH